MSISVSEAYKKTLSAELDVLRTTLSSRIDYFIEQSIKIGRRSCVVPLSPFPSLPQEDEEYLYNLYRELGYCVIFDIIKKEVFIRWSKEDAIRFQDENVWEAKYYFGDDYEEKEEGEAEERLRERKEEEDAPPSDKILIRVNRAIFAARREKKQECVVTIFEKVPREKVIKYYRKIGYVVEDDGSRNIFLSWKDRKREDWVGRKIIEQ